jgi:hypothetical protein
MDYGRYFRRCPVPGGSVGRASGLPGAISALWVRLRRYGSGEGGRLCRGLRSDLAGLGLPGLRRPIHRRAIYVEHPTDETVVGRDQLLDYIRREHEAEGVASVRMGTPVVEGDHVVGEFWTTMSKPGEIATLIGCFIAKLDEATGRCHHFRQYWHEVDERVTPYEGWGE